MAYDDKDMTKEVKSLASRFPKRGIDPTIPEDIRRQLMEMRRQEEQDKGMKAHEGRRLAQGGMAKYAKGGSVKGSGCEQRGLRKCKVV